MYSLELLIFEGEYLRSVLSNNFLFSNNLFNQYLTKWDLKERNIYKKNS